MEEKELPQEFKETLNESALLLAQNRPGEAAAKLEPLLEQAPDDADVAVNLSGAYILQRKWDKAVRILTDAVKRNPDNAMLWTNLGAAQLGRLETAGPKQQQLAMDAYYQALKADPYAPNVHYHLGLIHKDRGELTRATAMFQRAVEVNAADEDARKNLNRLASAGFETDGKAVDAESNSGADRRDVNATNGTDSV